VDFFISSCTAVERRRFFVHVITCFLFIEIAFYWAKIATLEAQKGQTGNKAAFSSVRLVSSGCTNKL
jgi:hypothetical protein